VKPSVLRPHLKFKKEQKEEKQEKRVKEKNTLGRGRIVGSQAVCVWGNLVVTQGRREGVGRHPHMLVAYFTISKNSVASNVRLVTVPSNWTVCLREGGERIKTKLNQCRVLPLLNTTCNLGHLLLKKPHGSQNEQLLPEWRPASSSPDTGGAP